MVVNARGAAPESVELQAFGPLPPPHAVSKAPATTTGPHLMSILIGAPFAKGVPQARGSRGASVPKPSALAVHRDRGTRSPLCDVLSQVDGVAKWRTLRGSQAASLELCELAHSREGCRDGARVREGGTHNVEEADALRTGRKPDVRLLAEEAEHVAREGLPARWSAVGPRRRGGAALTFSRVGHGLIEGEALIDREKRS